jgi:hypothetical protein
MRFVKSFILGAALLASIPGVAQAQDRRFHFNVGFGPTFITKALGDRFSTGFGPSAGVTFDVTNRIGVQAEYSFNRFHAENYVDLLGGHFTAHHDSHQIDFNLIFNLTPRDSSVRAYISGGGGAYYRSVTVTEYVGTGIVCDPYWYICGTVPITDVVGTRGGWDGGLNIGGGVGFRMGEDGEFYIESKFHYAKGPATIGSGLATGTSTNGKADGYYIPLTFGFRF